MQPALTPPEPIRRPRFAAWLFERGITLREAGERLGKSGEYVRLILLPFEDPRRREPDESTAALIDEWTRGEVSATDFQPPPAEDLIAESIP